MLYISVWTLTGQDSTLTRTLYKKQKTPEENSKSLPGQKLWFGKWQKTGREGMIMKLKLLFPMKPTFPPKLILFHPPSPHKQPSPWSPCPPRRLCLLAFLSFTFIFAYTRFPIKDTTTNGASTFPSHVTAHLPAYLSQTLLHYAASNSTEMRPEDARLVAGVLASTGPSNLLVFGLNFESLLWRALNHGGRTVFVDESAYRVSKFEEQHSGVEAYDVSFTAKVSEVEELVAAAREQAGGECRPVQNLLFSDCRLGINDLPNELYEVGWDVILVDGPSAPGRMAAIFTAGVMARSRREGKGTHVFVHDFDGEVERVLSEEFLCSENMMLPASSGSNSMAHFVIHSMELGSSSFCNNSTGFSSSSTSSSS